MFEQGKHAKTIVQLEPFVLSRTQLEPFERTHKTVCHPARVMCHSAQDGMPYHTAVCHPTPTQPSPSYIVFVAECPTNLQNLSGRHERLSAVHISCLKTVS
eukprot:230554-Chlamydomonas_euryale.AAC.1